MNNNQFLIGTIEEGITTNAKPWATQKDSWESLINAYQFRGRIVKKQPYSQVGQLSFLVATDNIGASAANFTANAFALHVPALSGVTIVPRFTTITANGAANYIITEDPENPGQLIQTGGAGVSFTSGTINYLTSDVSLIFSVNPGGNVLISYSYVYALPVMGLSTRELFALNQQDSVAFDTKFAYRFSNSSDQFIPLPSIMPTEWSGTDSQFFFTTNYAGAFWATNFKPGLHGWAVTEFSNTNAAVGLLAEVDVTAPGNTAQVNDYVHFINTEATVAGNSIPLAIVTVAGDPIFRIRAVAFPAIPKNLGTTFVYVNGLTATGMVLDSFQSVANQDGIRYYGDLSNGTGWANYNPPIDLNNALAGALLIFPYRGYLVFLNTWEGNEQVGGVFNFGNRARWTQIGTPYYSEPVPSTPNPQGFNIDAVRDDLFGKGGANDAPTQEVIIGAAFVRDILVVFFERSCWRLRFVNNAQNPFVWERINVELGSSATFSTIPFDKGAMAVGERGIIIADSNDVIRIDDKVPDVAFDIRINNEGMQRVHGIRTFKTRLNYWTYPDANNSTGIYPDSVLVYNYDTKTWAFLDDCFTCFGYLYKFDDLTWADLTSSWSTYDKITFGGSGIDDGSETLIAGNQQGFVLNLDQAGINAQPNQNFQNGASLMIDSITNASPSIFSSTNNTLPDGSWIVLSGIAGITDVNGISLNGRSFKIANPTNDANQFTIQEFSTYFAGSALGSSFNFTLSTPYIPVYPGSVNIYIGSLHFTDNGLNGVLTDPTSLSTGFIDYETGAISILFVPNIAVPTDVFIKVVSKDLNQELENIETIGTYTGGGYISKTSNFNLQTKIFNFLGQDKRSRLSRIDFYTNSTTNGEFILDVYGDSSNVPINTPLSDNLRSNIVKTSLNPYQVGDGDQTMYRLFSNAVAQTLQFNMSLTDNQMAVPVIAANDLEILAMNVTLRPGGRLL